MQLPPFFSDVFLKYLENLEYIWQLSQFFSCLLAVSLCISYCLRKCSNQAGFRVLERVRFSHPLLKKSPEMLINTAFPGFHFYLEK